MFYGAWEPFTVTSPESNVCRGPKICAQFPTWETPGPDKDKRESTAEVLLSGIQKDCNNWVAKCNECARVKVLPKRPRAPLGEMLVGEPLDRLASDTLGPFSESILGNKYVLVVTNYFMKWV